jgi:maltooligosyltrehalose synthase
MFDGRAQISTLSEIFVSWHEVVSAAEERLTMLEREKAKEATPDIS